MKLMKKKRGILKHVTKTNRIRTAAIPDSTICSSSSSQQYYYEQAGFAPFQHYYDWSSLRVPSYVYHIGPRI